MTTFTQQYPRFAALLAAVAAHETANSDIAYTVLDPEISTLSPDTQELLGEAEQEAAALTPTQVRTYSELSYEDIQDGRVPRWARRLVAVHELLDDIFGDGSCSDRQPVSLALLDVVDPA